MVVSFQLRALGKGLNIGSGRKKGNPELASDKQETNVLKNRKGKKDDMSTGGATDEKSRMMEQMNSNKGELLSWQWRFSERY